MRLLHFLFVCLSFIIISHSILLFASVCWLFMTLELILKVALNWHHMYIYKNTVPFYFIDTFYAVNGQQKITSFESKCKWDIVRNRRMIIYGDKHLLQDQAPLFTYFIHISIAYNGMQTFWSIWFCFWSNDRLLFFVYAKKKK